jgi:hypothetical protein
VEDRRATLVSEQKTSESDEDESNGAKRDASRANVCQASLRLGIQ